MSTKIQINKFEDSKRKEVNMWGHHSLGKKRKSLKGNREEGKEIWRQRKEIIGKFKSFEKREKKYRKRERKVVKKKRNRRFLCPKMFHLIIFSQSINVYPKNVRIDVLKENVDTLHHLRFLKVVLVFLCVLCSNELKNQFFFCYYILKKKVFNCLLNF